MKLYNLIVHAGPHARHWCPVQAELTPDREIALDRLYLHDTESGAFIPVQGWRTDGHRVAIVFVVPEMAAHETRRYELGVGEYAAAPGVQLTQDAPGQLRVTIGDEHFTTYNYGESVVRPYLYPVYAAGGVGVTRNWPMRTDVPGETNDHPHHKGIYTAQGDVNGVDNWGEGPNHGYQIHRGFDRLYSGPVAGGFTAQLDWTNAERKTNMTETRRMTFYRTVAAARLIDYEVSLHASVSEVKLGDTKEGGLLSVRVATPMDEIRPGGGRILTGVGSIGEAETWGKRAEWCDYSGPIGGKWYGITLLDHETNPRYPTYWHVRAYGLMTANPFGLHDYTGDPNQRWDMFIAKGETVTWRYRVLIHSGVGELADLALHYQGFIHPPQVEVQTA